MAYIVDARPVTAQQIAVVRGRASKANIAQGIRSLFDQFYSGFKSKGELNTIYYPGTGTATELDLECGVQVESGGNSQTPAGVAATTAYFGPYDKMGPAHEAIRQWCREQGREVAGPSWEVYGHWSEDPSRLRTDIYYLLAE